jgi:ABC-2 type transport system permease protein
MTQTWGPELIFLSIFSFASGVAFPVDLVPDWIYRIIEWTPVYYMVGFPALVFLNRLPEPVVLSGLIHGGIVTALTCVVVALMWRRGLGKFEAVGI